MYALANTKGDYVFAYQVVECTCTSVILLVTSYLTSCCEVAVLKHPVVGLYVGEVCQVCWYTWLKDPPILCPCGWGLGTRLGEMREVPCIQNMQRLYLSSLLSELFICQLAALFGTDDWNAITIQESWECCTGILSYIIYCTDYITCVWGWLAPLGHWLWFWEIGFPI